VNYAVANFFEASQLTQSVFFKKKKGRSCTQRVKECDRDRPSRHDYTTTVRVRRVASITSGRSPSTFSESRRQPRVRLRYNAVYQQRNPSVHPSTSRGDAQGRQNGSSAVDAILIE